MAEEIKRKYLRCPCKGCPLHTMIVLGDGTTYSCRSTCIRYKQWWKEDQDMRHRKWLDDQSRVFSDTARKQMDRNEKRRRK